MVGVRRVFPLRFPSVLTEYHAKPLKSRDIFAFGANKSFAIRPLPGLSLTPEGGRAPARLRAHKGPWPRVSGASIHGPECRRVLAWTFSSAVGLVARSLETARPATADMGSWNTEHACGRRICRESPVGRGRWVGCLRGATGPGAREIAARMLRSGPQSQRRAFGLPESPERSPDRKNVTRAVARVSFARIHRVPGARCCHRWLYA